MLKSKLSKEFEQINDNTRTLEIPEGTIYEFYDHGSTIRNSYIFVPRKPKGE